MNKLKVNEALQELIIRLQDSEKGYLEIGHATSNLILKKWMKKYSQERHEMHKELEINMMALGGDPEVKTSFLGELHRMFIDIKLNSFFDNFDSIVNEIERGAKILISDYEKVLSDVEMPVIIRNVLVKQKMIIDGELKQLVYIRDEVQA